jgi:hypothetical protein
MAFTLRQVRYLPGKPLLATSGNLLDVSSHFVGAPVADDSNKYGVFTAYPDNQGVVRLLSDGSVINDGFGNPVYLRLILVDGAWIINFYSLLGGFETPYFFGSPTDLQWFFNVNFNPALSSLIQQPSSQKATYTLASGDITNGYIDLPIQASVGSIFFHVKGQGYQVEDDDYSVNYSGGVGGGTRISFLGDLLPGNRSALGAGDKIVVHYFG